MKPLFVRRVLFMTSAFTLSILLFACNKSINSMNNNNAPVSGLMAFNLATDKAATIIVGGSSITNAPLTFESYTGNYLNVYSGNKLVQSYDYNSNTPLDSVSYTFEPQKYYSMFVVGSNGHYHNIIVNDNFDSLSPSQTYVRYVNAIADSSAPTVTISSSGDNTTSNSAAFGSVSNFSAVSPGNVTVQVSNGGNINKSRTISLDQQKVYTVLLAGTPGSTGNDSLQIKYIENGTLTQKAQKSSSAVGSMNSK